METLGKEEAQNRTKDESCESNSLDVGRYRKSPDAIPKSNNPWPNVCDGRLTLKAIS